MRLIGNLILLVIIFCFTMSFNFFKSSSRDYCDVAREIRSKVGKSLAKQHKMDLIGIGGGMMGSVYMIGLSFQIHHPMDRDEARWRIVDCVEELLKAFNENEEIRPFLKNYPFTTKNVQVAIFTNYSDGKEVFHPDIRVVGVHERDEITYYTMEPNNPRYKSEYCEPYQEALEKVKGQKQMPKNISLGMTTQEVTENLGNPFSQIFYYDTSGNLIKIWSYRGTTLIFENDKLKSSKN